MTSALRAARTYRERGWRPIPIEFRSKRPARQYAQNWAQLELELDDLPNVFNNAQWGVGVLLGTPSGSLVDVDLDCPFAVRLAPSFLPPTEAVFGRTSKPSSHWLYCVAGLTTTKYQAGNLGGDGASAMLLEIRSSGCQTVFPGSIHETGEPIRGTVVCRENEPLVLVKLADRQPMPDLSASVFLQYPSKL